MEEFRCCPICLEVPENEIYQCPAGHVICDSCASKVTRCPHCRAVFATPKIRNRALERIMDDQVFECKFKDNGCPVFCKREVITSHANTCPFNPDTVLLCEQMGHTDCKFRLGCVSRAEVISHFDEVHNCAKSTFPLIVSGTTLMSMLQENKKPDTSIHIPSLVLFGLVSSHVESSPLFLILGKINHETSFLSLMCVKVWESSSEPPMKAEFTLLKCQLGQNNRRELDTNLMSNASIPPFPFGGIMNVGDMNEAHSLFNVSPINIPISLLEHTQFGSDEGGRMMVRIQKLDDTFFVRIANTSSSSVLSDPDHAYTGSNRTYHLLL